MQSSGPIRFSDIRTQFGSTYQNMSKFKGLLGLPASGPMKMSALYGKAKPAPVWSASITLAAVSGAGSLTLTTVCTDASGSALTFALNTNPLSNATLAGSVLTVTNKSTGSAYAIKVIATNVFGAQSTGTINVTDGAPPLTAYPTAGMTADTSVISGGTYLASSSTAQSPSYNAFDKANGTRWASVDGVYNNSSGGTYKGTVTTTVSGQAVLGEWVQLQLPAGIKIASYTLTPRSDGLYMMQNRNARAWTLAGSTDGATWTLVDTRTGVNWNASDPVTYSLSMQTPAYQYFRYIVQGIGNDGTADHAHASVTELAFNVMTPQPAYPPAAMTADTAVLSNGTYVATASTVFGPYVASRAFNKSAAYDQWWVSAGSVYASASGGAYTGAVTTTVSGQAVKGEWVQLQLPSAIRVSSYSISPRQDADYSIVNRNPRSWTLAGSTDNATWTLIDSQAGYNWSGAIDLTCIPPATNTGAYNYVRLIVQAVGNDNTFDHNGAQLGELILNGA